MTVGRTMKYFRSTFKFLPAMERSVLREGFTLILLFISTPWGLQASPHDRKGLYINSTKKTWKDASRSCSLVGSDRSPSYDVNAQEIPVLWSRYLGGKLQAGTLYWIGATATFTPWFELLGCQVIVPSQTVSTLTNLSLVIGPVADCYKQCNNHFGINETHCYCLSTLKGKYSSYTCGLSRFSHFKTDVIGKRNTDSKFDSYYQFAMYEVLDNNKLTTKADTLDECLINTTTGEMTTRPCDTADSSGQTWINRVLRGLPLEGPGPGQWTPYTRRRLLRWTAGNENIQKRTACVSLWRNNQTDEIALRPCNETHAYICQIKNDPITSASTKTSLSIGTRGTEPRNRTYNTGKVGAMATTAMQSRDLTPTLLPKNENEASVLPVIAGSVAAGCILVLIIAISIILRVKRRANSKQQSVSAATENVHYSGIADEETPLQGITTSSADDRMTDKTSHDSSERCQLAQGDEDRVYNHTWDKTITEKQTDHVYSSAHSRNEYDCVNSDVYNHTWDKPITEEITDHVYSSTSSRNDANVYDHTNSRN
ncbi:uncharacterized protein LOC111117937 isoform X4 [Crassostrea virginica]